VAFVIHGGRLILFDRALRRRAAGVIKLGVVYVLAGLVFAGLRGAERQATRPNPKRFRHTRCSGGWWR
jgi:hypothetical protein